jgi:hypothetical protein
VRAPGLAYIPLDLTGCSSELRGGFANP